MHPRIHASPASPNPRELSGLAGNDWLDSWFEDRAKLATRLGVTPLDAALWSELERDVPPRAAICSDYLLKRCARADCGRAHVDPVFAGAPVMFHWAVREVMDWCWRSGTTDSTAWTLECVAAVNALLSEITGEEAVEFKRSLAYSRAVYHGDPAFFDPLRILVDSGGFMQAPPAPPGREPAGGEWIGVADTPLPDPAVAAAVPEALEYTTSGLSVAESGFRSRLARTLDVAREALLTPALRGDGPGLQQRVTHLISRGLDSQVLSMLLNANVSTSVGSEWTPRIVGADGALSMPGAAATPHVGSGGLPAHTPFITAITQRMTMCRGVLGCHLDEALAGLLRARSYDFTGLAFSDLTLTDLKANAHRGGIYATEGKIEGRNVVVEVVKTTNHSKQV